MLNLKKALTELSKIIDSNSVKNTRLYVSDLSISNGTIDAAEIRIKHNKHMAVINVYLRISGATARPVITINNFPEDIEGFDSSIGSVGLVRGSTDGNLSYATDNCYLMHATGESKAYIRTYNYIGYMPSNGYLVINGTFIL